MEHNIKLTESVIPTQILEFFKSNNVLTLATCDKEPWVCTLYYGADDQLNIYLVTDPNSIHGQMIKINSIVAFNIFDSRTAITEPKVGIQGKGACTQVKDITEVAKGLLLWHKFNPGVEKNITTEDIKKWKDTKVYKIQPSYIKHFNKPLYGKEGYLICKL